MKDDELFEPIALKREGKWYCEDCFRRVFCLETSSLETVYNKSDDSINENTSQYEQYPGELIPLKGVKCCRCRVKLIDPLDW